MLVVKTKVKQSDTHGLGLFAEENLKKGQLVVEPSTPGLDIELDGEEFERLPKHEQDFIAHYGFRNKYTVRVPQQITGIEHSLESTRHIKNLINLAIL